MALSSYITLDQFQHLWDTMVIDKYKQASIIADAKKILRHKETFEAISAKTGGLIPWYFIGIIYFKEEGCNFKGHMHNGDPLRHRTTNVPAGRPILPPANAAAYSFEESAIDAILLKEFHSIRAWILPMMLYHFEKYNGFGYRSKGINSPYLWNSTNHYTKGYFTGDHKFDTEAVCKPTGAAPLLRYLTDKTLGLIQ